MKLYAARDKRGDCFLYESKPIECIDGVWQSNQCRFYSISPRLFPELTHENSPMEVELVIKRE